MQFSVHVFNSTEFFNRLRRLVFFCLISKHSDLRDPHCKEIIDLVKVLLCLRQLNFARFFSRYPCEIKKLPWDTPGAFSHVICCTYDAGMNLRSVLCGTWKVQRDRDLRAKREVQFSFIRDQLCTVFLTPKSRPQSAP